MSLCHTTPPSVGQAHTGELTLSVWDGDVTVQEVHGDRTVTYVYEPGSFVPFALITTSGGIEAYESTTKHIGEIPGQALMPSKVVSNAGAGSPRVNIVNVQEKTLRLKLDNALIDAKQVTQNENVLYYQCDHLGTPVELYDELGKVEWSAHYHAWGRVSRQLNRGGQQYIRFQGQYEDQETGMFYNRHRYYAPDGARFLTQDPIGLLGGANSYQYAPIPTDWIDPLGLTRFTKTSWGPCDKGTGLAYTVYQQDIDWNLSHKGKINLQRASEGGAPYIMKNGTPQQIQLHHSRQQSIGPLFEVTTSTHCAVSGKGREALHPFGDEKNRDFPVDRPLFDKDRDQYWKDRASEEKQKRNGGGCFI